MKNCLAALLVALATVGITQAHFIWIVPAKDLGHIYFSDLPEADSPKLLDKIAQTEVFLRRADGMESALEKNRGKQSFEIKLPAERSGVLLGVCHYGVLSKPNQEPFLLKYYAKAHLDQSEATTLAASKRLPLEVVRMAGKGSIQVIWQGKPLAGAEVVVVAPGDELPATHKSGQDGTVTLGALKAGTYGIRARHIEDRAGEEDGKAYKQVRHYSTLVFEIAAK